MANESPRRNVVVFGEAGAGKTSIITMIADPGVAENIKNYYDTEIDGARFRLWDTPSDEGTAGWGDNAVVNLCRVIQRMEGVVSLFVYCVRGPRIKDTTAKNYRLFHSMFFRSEVPIVLVVTGLEEEEPMDEWWRANKVAFQKHKMIFAGYACVTGTKGKLRYGKYIYEDEYAESAKRLRRLISDPNLNNPKTTMSPMVVIRNLRTSATNIFKSPERKRSGEFENIDVGRLPDDNVNQGKVAHESEMDMDGVKSNQLKGGSHRPTGEAENENVKSLPEKSMSVAVEMKGEMKNDDVGNNGGQAKGDRAVRNENKKCGDNVIKEDRIPDDSGEEVTSERSAGGPAGSAMNDATKKSGMIKAISNVFKFKLNRQSNGSMDRQVDTENEKDGGGSKGVPQKSDKWFKSKRFIPGKKISDAK